MPLTCNIDEKGARARLTYGILLLIMSCVLGGLALWSDFWWLWFIVVFLLLAGSFAIFESRKKWCVLRAMGIKTAL